MKLSCSSIRDSQDIGKLADDLASEAIARYIEHPEKFKPERSSNDDAEEVFLNYLKWGILRTLIHNYKSKGQNVNEIRYEDHSHYNLLKESSNLDDKLDFESFVESIENFLIENEEEDLINLFIEMYVNDSTREETAQKLGINEQQYLNSYKKLHRRIKTIRAKLL